MYEVGLTSEKYNVDPPTLVGSERIGCKLLGPAKAMIESSTHSCAENGPIAGLLFGGWVQDHSNRVVL